ncbi:MAG TPA: TOMM precursor leader peptide-binding protein [Acidimicrobiales bacterium]|nr:TOMM precursor leader peptide-binding protein [Acidimicrobiales bacterium]
MAPRQPSPAPAVDDRAKPVLPGFYRVIPMGPDTLQLRTSGKVLRVATPGVGDFGARLLGALDGQRTLAEVVEQLELDRDAAAELVRQLLHAGVLSDASDDAAHAPPPVGGNAAAHELYGELGHRPGSVQAAISGARVAMVGLGPVARLAARHLAAAGIGELVLVDDAVVTSTDQFVLAGDASGVGWSRAEVARDECSLASPTGDPRSLVRITGDAVGHVARQVDLVVVEVDEAGDRVASANDECLAAGVPALFHSATTLDAVVGPMALPGTQGCYRCLARRGLSHIRHYDEMVAYQQFLVDGNGARQPGLISGFAAMIAGLLSLEALRQVGGFLDPVTVGGVLMTDVRTSLVRREELLPVPACPACDAREQEEAG